MSIVDTIAALEERLRIGELGPDPNTFQELLADNAVIVGQNGVPVPKSRIVEAHQPASGPKFTRVDMSDLRIVDHGTAVVVTCRGTYENPQSTIALHFLRVWVKKDNGWQIIAASVADSAQSPG